MKLDFENEFSKLTLIKDKIPPLNNKLYAGKNIFYLTGGTDDYLGHIEYSYLDKNKILIDNSYSEYRGFYELLFKLILTKTPITMIFGGYRQSHRAINSWKKRLEKFNKKVYNTETQKVEDFDVSKENEYWTKNIDISKKYLVGLSESDNNFIEDYNEIEKLLETKKELGRIGVPVVDIFVRYYRLNVDEVEEILEKYKDDYFIDDLV